MKKFNKQSRLFLIGLTPISVALSACNLPNPDLTQISAVGKTELNALADGFKFSVENSEIKKPSEITPADIKVQTSTNYSKDRYNLNLFLTNADDFSGTLNFEYNIFDKQNKLYSARIASEITKLKVVDAPDITATNIKNDMINQLFPVPSTVGMSSHKTLQDFVKKYSAGLANSEIAFLQIKNSPVALVT